MQYDEYQPGQSDRSLYMSAFGKAVLWLTSDKFWSLHEKKIKKYVTLKKRSTRDAVQSKKYQCVIYYYFCSSSY